MVSKRANTPNLILIEPFTGIFSKRRTSSLELLETQFLEFRHNGGSFCPSQAGILHLCEKS